MKICYMINTNNGKSYFTRIGVAFVNRDGSLNVKLNATPINGEIHIRDYVPRRDGDAPKPPVDDSQPNLPGTDEEWVF